MKWLQKILNPPYIQAIDQGGGIILKKFNEFPRVDEPLEIELKLTVRVVGDSSQFSHPPFRDPAKRVYGCAYRDRIEIIGARKDGQIIFDPSILGHEFWHAISMLNGRVMNPDALQKER